MSVIIYFLMYRYKERLQWKYLANQQRQLNTLTSHKWRFLSSSEGDVKFQKKVRL